MAVEFPNYFTDILKIKLYAKYHVYFKWDQLLQLVNIINRRLQSQHTICRRGCFGG